MKRELLKLSRGLTQMMFQPPIYTFVALGAILGLTGAILWLGEGLILNYLEEQDGNNGSLQEL